MFDTLILCRSLGAAVSYTDTHNEFRRLHGHPPLQYDASLEQAAQRWADFSIANFDGESILTHLKKYCKTSSNSICNDLGTGENLSWYSNQGGTINDAVDSW